MVWICDGADCGVLLMRAPGLCLGAEPVWKSLKSCRALSGLMGPQELALVEASDGGDPPQLLRLGQSIK